MQSSLIEQLHCPCCGSAFDVELRSPESGPEIRHAILRCRCYRYPVIDGIAVLRQRSGPGDTHDRGVELLAKRDFAGALQYALESLTPISRPAPTWRDKVKRRVHKNNGAASSFHESLHSHRPPAYANYLFHRYANNSFLAAIPLLLMVRQGNPSGRLLDLNCGIGHASFFLQSMFPNLTVYATDHDYVNLHLVKRYIAPRALCLCLDAELPLPFPDHFFDTALCMDGLHYVRSKQACLRELDRTLQPEGLWLFPHMHNALATNITPGIPLAPADYQRCFSFLEHRLLPEAAVFETFMREQRLDLSTIPTPKDLDQSPVLSLVGSRNPTMWRTHDLSATLLSTAGRLAVNPIYRHTEGPNGITLDMAWPSAALEKECGAIQQFLPRSCTLETPLWRALQAGAPLDANTPAVRKLIHSFVLLPLPEGYRQ